MDMGASLLEYGSVLNRSSDAVCMTPEKPEDSEQTRHRWHQYRLRALLVFVLLASIGMSWFATRKRFVKRQREAVRAIRELGGRVECEEEGETSLPSWLRGLLGDEFFFLKAPIVDLSDTQVTDAELVHLNGVTGLEMLDLSNTQISDTGLEHLKGIKDLKWLYLGGTQVTDAGLERLKEITSLQDVFLDRTQVTDAGLEHLSGMTNLNFVGLLGTQVTPEGVKKLREALPECEIAH
jgi:hypothetical protein